jgi:hypothetical protein
MDGPSTVALFEMDPLRGVDAFHSDARIRKLKHQCHWEAAGMGCAEQLLRVGPLAVSHARAEVVWTVKCAAPKPHVPAPRARFPRHSASAVLIAITISNESNRMSKRMSY